MSTTPKRGLGRGFEALISQDFDKSLLLTADDRVEKIPLDQLQAGTFQPRRHFDETALAELAA
jgi:ParB family chromosome partitioning protein